MTAPSATPWQERALTRRYLRAKWPSLTRIALSRVLVAPAESDYFDGSGRNVPGERFGDQTIAAIYAGRAIGSAHKRASASAAPDDRFRAPGNPRLVSAWATKRSSACGAPGVAADS